MNSWQWTAVCWGIIKGHEQPLRYCIRFRLRFYHKDFIQVELCPNNLKQSIVRRLENILQAFWSSRHSPFFFFFFLQTALSFSSTLLLYSCLISTGRQSTKTRCVQNYWTYCYSWTQTIANIYLYEINIKQKTSFYYFNTMILCIIKNLHGFDSMLPGNIRRPISCVLLCFWQSVDIKNGKPLIHCKYRFKVLELCVRMRLQLFLLFFLLSFIGWSDKSDRTAENRNGGASSAG